MESDMATDDLDYDLSSVYDYYNIFNTNDSETSGFDYSNYKATMIKNQESECAAIHHPSEAMAAMMSLIIIIGLFGNGVVFFVILVLREYKNSVAHWYVLQLAIADTLFLLMLPFSAYSSALGKWTLHENLCKAKEGMLFINFYASIAFLTIMSFDRYLAVTRISGTGWAQEIRTMPVALTISLITWACCIALATPVYRFSHVGHCEQCVYQFPTTDLEECAQAGVNETHCAQFLDESKLSDAGDLWDLDFDLDLIGSDEYETIRDLLQEKIPTNVCKDVSVQSLKTWLYLNFFIAFLLPLVAICGFYGLILRTMMGTGTLVQNSNQRRYRRRVTLMVLALVSLFTITWLPWYAVKLARLNGFQMSESGCNALLQFTFIFAYFNSALNPYFYSFMGSHFYRRFAKARTTAQKSRLLSAISRMSAHADSSNSTSDKNIDKPKQSRKRSSAHKHAHNNDSDAKTTQPTERTML